jgi:hypothetical protein
MVGKGSIGAKSETIGEMEWFLLKNMAEVFERAVDISLEKKDPKKKRAPRLAKKRLQRHPREKKLELVLVTRRNPSLLSTF